MRLTANFDKNERRLAFTGNAEISSDYSDYTDSQYENALMTAMQSLRNNDCTHCSQEQGCDSFSGAKTTYTPYKGGCSLYVRIQVQPGFEWNKASCRNGVTTDIGLY